MNKVEQIAEILHKFSLPHINHEILPHITRFTLIFESPLYVYMYNIFMHFCQNKLNKYIAMRQPMINNLEKEYQIWEKNAKQLFNLQLWVILVGQAQAARWWW